MPFQEVSYCQHLSRIESVCTGNHISANCSLAALGHLVHLCGQALDKIIEPASQIHLMLSYALQRRVETISIAVVILTDREQLLEIVASPIQAKRGQQPRGSAIAIHKRMDVDQLKLCDAADQHW